jgi:hypothetical protein
MKLDIVLKEIGMNERIKQLALESGLVRNGDWGMKRWEGPRSDSISDQDLEKFADLIRADEREACAKLAATPVGTIAAAIRARGTT